MKEITKSAAKIVFLMMAIGLNVALFTDKITAEQYIPLVAMAFTFYFANKGEADEPYLGK